MIDIIIGILLIGLSLKLLGKEIEDNWGRDESYFNDMIFHLPVLIAMIILGSILAFTDVSIIDIFSTN